MGSKYIIDGITLDEYCKIHELNFKTQSNRVRNYIKNHPELDEKEAIKLAIARCGVHPGTKFMYGEISLAEWCRQNDKSYDCIISRVERLKETFPSINNNEATRIAIEDYSDKGIKYFYDGMPLVDYCKLHPEYAYSNISLYIRRKKEKNPSLTYQEIINSYFKTSHTTHTYHFIDDIPLLEYCDNYDIPYTSIIQTLAKIRKNEKYKDLSEQERLNIAKEEVITRLKNQAEKDNLNNIFSYLKKEKNIDDKMLKDFLLYLKIDYQNFMYLKEKFTSIADTILFIWYFYDKISEDFISVSNKRFEEITVLINSLPNTKEEIMKIDLYLLIALYKANLVDTRYLILLHQEDFNYYTLLDILKNYGVYWEDNEKKELIEDANLHILELIEKNNVNNAGMVVNYITKSTRFFLIKKVLDLLKQENNVSLNSPVYKDGKLEVIDMISKQNNESILSDKMQDVISSLDSLSQSFIYYKYYEQLSNKEISSIINIDLEELNAFEKSLLERLSENESLIKLVKE